jgi:hypothetical protein
MLQSIRKSEANFDVQSSLADHATDALKKHIIRSGGDGIEKVLTQALAASAADMEAVSKAISTSIDILSSTWDDFVDYVDSVQDGAITGIETDVATNASKGIMTKVGVGFDLSGEPDYGRLLTNPDGVYTTDTVDRMFDDLVNEYASETGKTVTGGKMREMLSMNFSFAITGRDLAEEATIPVLRDLYQDTESSWILRQLREYPDFLDWQTRDNGAAYDPGTGCGLVRRDDGQPCNSGWTWFEYFSRNADDPHDARNDYVPAFPGGE